MSSVISKLILVFFQQPLQLLKLRDLNITIRKIVKMISKI